MLGAWADGNVTFTASAPDVVVSGDQFRLTYTVNTHKVRDFRAPNIKGFDVLMGPSRSQQSSTQIIMVMLLLPAPLLLLIFDG